METIPHMTLDEMYVSPFTARRTFDGEGHIVWVPIERNLSPTGQRHIDFLISSLANGQNDLDAMAEKLGCTRIDLYGLFHAITGTNVREFCLAYSFRLADDMLRYTSLPIREIARRSGFGSVSVLCQQYKRYRRMTAAACRRSMRAEGDKDRYRV